MSRFDQTLQFAVKGYAWLPDLRRHTGGRPAPFRMLGRRAIAIAGPDAARFFYTEGNLDRRIPVAIRRSGEGAVQALDGSPHQHRKALFVALLTGDGVDQLADQVDDEFVAAARRWRGGPAISLFDETARIMTTAVTRWLGVPETQRDLDALPADLIAMVAGPRHARARAARRRRERWSAALIEEVRADQRARTPLATIAHHREAGYLLDPRTAAVELLDFLRPATAVTWLVTFAAHALDRWPRLREELRTGGDEYARAFAHEVRRFYPFTPFVAGRATRDLSLSGVDVPAGTLVLLDVYGQHHDERFWPQPYAFRPERFLGRPIGEFELVPQGGGDPRTGHRCPGEPLTVAVLSRLAKRLAGLDYYLPPQHTGIDLSRVPARPRDGIRLVVPAEQPVCV